MVSIVSVAFYDGKTIISMPRPARHCDVIREFPIQLDPRVWEQGFLTSTGVFLDRRLSMVVAEAAGQVREGQHGKKELYSEDVW